MQNPRTPGGAPEASGSGHTDLGSPLYLLERSSVGVVSLDCELRVIAMNSFAREVLPVEQMKPFDKAVLSFHPERSRSKVSFLIDQADCPVSNPPPMTMLINIPERVLMIKVAKLADNAGQTTGYTLIFYDITEVVSVADATQPPAPARRQLAKIPTISQNRIVLIDAQKVTFIRAEGHYSSINTESGASLCNLSIGDLAVRLDPALFMRVHRSYLVSLDYVEQIDREGGKVSVVLRDGLGTLPVARSYVTQLLQRLGIAEADSTGQEADSG